MEAAVGMCRRPHLFRGEPAAVARQSARLQSGECRGSSELGDHDVRRLLHHQLGAPLAEDRERDLVAHRRRRQVHGLFVAEQSGDALLEREHRRVLPLLLVTDVGPRHRLAHALRRLRLRVGTKIDHLTGI